MLGFAMKEPLMIIGGDIFTPRGIVHAGLLVVEDGIITEIGPYGLYKFQPKSGRRTLEVPGKIVAPGYIDIHVHGGGGYDLSHGTEEAILSMARAHCLHGTTAMLPTLVASPREVMLESAASLARAMKRGADARSGAAGAAILGMHLEGPWLNPERKGAQNVEAIRRPDLEEFDETNRAACGHVSLVTLAPEVEGGMEAIEGLRSRGVTVAAGHTSATYDIMVEAVRRGLSHCIHAFNGMSAFHHREPGTVGAMLSLDELSCEAIVDGFHLHPAALKVLFRCKGRDKIALITDAVMAAGMPEGEYELGGQPVKLVGGAVRLMDGTLAGSALTMDRAVQNTVRTLGISLYDAVMMASFIPARVIGLDGRKGSLEAGKDADILVLDREGNVEVTVVGGVIVHRRL